jgi:hypothetical protein
VALGVILLYPDGLLGNLLHPGEHE